MPHTWVVLFLLVCTACSDRAVRSTTGSVPYSAEEDTVAGADPEQPRVILRCEAGQIEAYIVMGADGEPGAIKDRAVRIQLDSALRC